MAKPYAVITRNGDHFYFKDAAEKEPRIRTLTEVFQAAGRIIDGTDKAIIALNFLVRSLKSIASDGKGIDEYGVRGISALCETISDALMADYDEIRTEAAIIEDMAGSIEEPGAMAKAA